MILKEQKKKKIDLVPRVVASLFLCAGVFVLPWWLLLIGGILFTIVIPQYIEILIIGLVFDSVHGMTGTPIFLGTLMAGGLFILIHKVQNVLRF